MKRSVVFVATIAMLLAIPMAIPAVGSPPDNPFVGAWESIDPDPDNSFVRLQINQTGDWRIRDDGGTVCWNNGFGFVAATTAGSGSFGAEGDTFDADPGDIYCYPRDSRGRELAVAAEDLDEVGYAYRLDLGDVLVDQNGVCWWRSGTGDPAECPSD